MIDASVLFSPLERAGAGSVLQPLPAPDNQHVLRFESIMNQSLAGHEDVVPTLADKPVLEITTVQTDNGVVDFKEAAIDKLSSMDDAYQRMVSQFGDMPKFSDFLSERIMPESQDKLRTYPEIHSPQNNKNHFEASTSATQEHMNAVLEYEGMLTRWSVNAQMLISKFSLISSAVNQVSQGFKTLFQSG